MMKGDVLMFNRNSGVNQPYMGVAPAVRPAMVMGGKPGLM